MSVCFNCEKYLGGEIGSKNATTARRLVLGMGMAFALAVLFVWVIWRFY